MSKLCRILVKLNEHNFEVNNPTVMSFSLMPSMQIVYSNLARYQKKSGYFLHIRCIRSVTKSQLPSPFQRHRCWNSSAGAWASTGPTASASARCCLGLRHSCQHVGVESQPIICNKKLRCLMSQKEEFQFANENIPLKFFILRWEAKTLNVLQNVRKTKLGFHS